MKIPYSDDYLNYVHETVEKYKKLEQKLEEAKRDIAALLWLNGNCEYCAYGEKEEYSGANRWICKLGNGVDCRPEWKGDMNG